MVLVREDQANHVVHVTLNRPTIHNSFNEEGARPGFRPAVADRGTHSLCRLTRRVCAVIGTVASTFSGMTKNFPAARCVVLSGEGKSFSAGILCARVCVRACVWDVQLRSAH